ncbi:MAG TPA: TraB/GumN family protein [Spirochaetia bacterium]|nr:TraB/GumN family protein [Spirochaetia bacterium]
MSLPRHRSGAIRAAAIGLAALLLFCAATLTAQADPASDQAAAPGEPVPLLWRVEGDAASIYLYGSIHIAPPEALPPPMIVRDAFAATDILVTEVLIDDALEAELTAALLSAGALAEDLVLRDLFADAEWELLSERLASLGLAPSDVERMKPWVVDLIVTDLSTLPLGFSAENGLDVYFARKATARAMEQLALESVAEQIAILSGGSLEEQADALMVSITELESPEAILGLYDAWRDGDVEALEAIIADAYDPSDRAYDRLFRRRNLRWLATLEDLLSGDEDAFVVAGAGHLVGPDSLPRLLGDMGYTVARILNRRSEP